MFILIPSQPTSAATPKSRYSVQIAAFRSTQNAKNYQKKLRNQLSPALFSKLRIIPQRGLHIFSIGCVRSRKEAAQILKTIARTHPEAFIYRLSPTQYESFATPKRNVTPSQKQAAISSQHKVRQSPTPTANQNAATAVRSSSAKTNTTIAVQVPSQQTDEPNAPRTTPTATATAKPLQPELAKREMSPTQPAAAKRPQTLQKQTDTARVQPLPLPQSEQGDDAATALPQLTQQPAEKADLAFIYQETQTTFVGLGLLLSGIIWWALSRRDKKVLSESKPLMHSHEGASSGTDNAPQADAATQKAPSTNDGPPRLPESLEKTLLRSGNTLSMVESNLHSRDRTAQSVYVTSCFKGEGKTTSAIHLAWGLAQESRLKILLVDWNHSSPQIEKLFGVPRSPGLVQYLKKTAQREECIYETAYDGLSIMPIGDTTGRLTEISRTNELDQQLETLSRDYDYIIFDGHSLMGAATAILADRFDGIVITVEAERTKWEVVQEATEKIEKMGGEILGIVLNKRRFYIPKFLYGKI